MAMKRSVFGRLGVLALGASAIALITVSYTDRKEITAVEQTANDSTRPVAANRIIEATTSASTSHQTVVASSWQGLVAASPPDRDGLTAASYGPSPAIAWPYERERYPSFEGNGIKLVGEEPVSTFSIDVDTASYANVRRFLSAGVLPPLDAVRTEELINYFDYKYSKPAFPDEPFQVDLALFEAPWDANRQLLRIGVQAYEIPSEARPPLNLVFLVDTSGSMDSPDKLPLVQQSFKMLARELDGNDRISIVTYAEAAKIALEPTRGSERSKILSAIEAFQAGGRTAGAAAIQMAYRLAEAEFDDDATNRVILATDGDFNVGVSDPELLEKLIAKKRQTGIYLSILGFGGGNLNDLLMQKLAQAGNGNAAYIDSVIEAKKVLIDEIGTTLIPVANDVKLQVEFNPAVVAEYRLIGYETRLLKRPDFNDDRVDAGEVGSNHSVTAVYEVTSPESPARLMDDLRYGEGRRDSRSVNQNEVAWLRLRYKLPGAAESRMIEQPVPAAIGTTFDKAADDARFAAAIAGFGRLLRQDPSLGAFSFEDVHRIVRSARGTDPNGHRSEFMRLVEMAATLAAVN
jgi:Ca-activated chloride channel homolog